MADKRVRCTCSCCSVDDVEDNFLYQGYQLLYEGHLVVKSLSLTLNVKTSTRYFNEQKSTPAVESQGKCPVATVVVIYEEDYSACKVFLITKIQVERTLL